MSLSKKAKANLERFKVFGTVKLSSKGQIAIPADLRKEYGLEQGDTLFVLGVEGNKAFALFKFESLPEVHGELDRLVELAVKDNSPKKKPKD